jgi:hypothetical protein
MCASARQFVLSKKPGNTPTFFSLRRAREKIHAFCQEQALSTLVFQAIPPILHRDDADADTSGRLDFVR